MMQATDTRNFERVPDGVNVPRGSYAQIDLGCLGVWRFELDKKNALDLAKGVKKALKKGCNNAQK